MSDKAIILKADEDLLNGLHQLVAQSLIEKIQSGEATIQEIGAAIKFLKDNNVTADITYSPAMRQLDSEVQKDVGQLPFVEGEDEDNT